MDILALADRVEAAGGPDRELDREICLALRSGRWISPTAVPRCTVSLDAAMTLVPGAATGWSINNDRLENEALVFRAGDGVIGRGNAATPAPALTAACLRALAKDTPHA